MAQGKCCLKCPQKECGMRDEPMTWEQINNLPPPVEDPPYPLACWFLNCGNLGIAVSIILESPELFENQDLVPVETYAKPHHSETRPHGITGKFVDRGGYVYVIRRGQRIFLSNPIIDGSPRLLDLVS